MTTEPDRGDVPIGPSVGRLALILVACTVFVAVGLFLVVAGILAGGFPQMAPPMLIGAAIAGLFGFAAVSIVVRTVRQGPVLVLTPTGIESHGWSLPWDQIDAIGVADTNVSLYVAKRRWKWVGVRLRDPQLLLEQDGPDLDAVARQLTAMSHLVLQAPTDPQERLAFNREHGGGYDVIWPAQLLPGQPDGVVELITAYGIRHGLRLAD